MPYQDSNSIRRDLHLSMSTISTWKRDANWAHRKLDFPVVKAYIDILILRGGLSWTCR